MRQRSHSAVGTAALVLGASALVGCAGPSVPISGTTVGTAFWNQFFPTPAVGMEWDYNVTMTGQSDSTASDKVTAVSGDTFTESTVFAGQTGTSTGSVSDPGAGFTTGSATASFVSDGPDNVTVPDGTFNGAAKLHISGLPSGTTEYLWLAPGVGVVKVETTTSVGSSSIVVTEELSKFTK